MIESFGYIDYFTYLCSLKRPPRIQNFYSSPLVLLGGLPLGSSFSPKTVKIMNKIKDLTGKKFGRLTAISPHGRSVSGKTLWKCECECGNTSIVSSSNLQSNGTKSCGCLRGTRGDASAFNRVFSRYKASAKFKGHEFALTESEFKSITKTVCHYCGVPPSSVNKHTGGSGTYVYNGIDRVDNSIGYVVDNCVPCCGDCNYAKRNLSYHDFLSLISRISKNLSLC